MPDVFIVRDLAVPMVLAVVGYASLRLLRQTPDFPEKVAMAQERGGGGCACSSLARPAPFTICSRSGAR